MQQVSYYKPFNSRKIKLPYIYNLIFLYFTINIHYLLKKYLNPNLQINFYIPLTNQIKMKKN